MVTSKYLDCYQEIVFFLEIWHPFKINSSYEYFIEFILFLKMFRFIWNG